MNGRPIGGSLFNHVPFFIGQGEFGRKGGFGKVKGARNTKKDLTQSSVRTQSLQRRMK
jgi:hypothetical protein